MTCIVGLQHNNRVYIGGDSVGVDGWGGRTIRADSKVFRVNGYVMGFTTSFRMGQLLRHTFDPPRLTGDPERFMVAEFIPAVTKCLRKGKWLKEEDERVEGGTFLVAYKEHLFTIYEDFQVGLSSVGYDAVGCGDSLALGALFASEGKRPKDRVRLALEAAEFHQAGVAGPFVIESTR